VRYLLDTCVISEAIKVPPDPTVMRWMDDRNEESLFLSAMTIGELQKGITKLADGKRRRELQRWVETDLLVRFAGRILAADEAVTARWGVLQGQAAKQGRTLPVIDSLLAATALAHNLLVATRNVADFERSGVTVVNPWET
jgi:predicted nucleic acid-binding protein